MIEETLDSQLISSISAKQLALKDIFCDDYLFTIPNYQRPYSWEDEHCTQLLDDLHSFASKSNDINKIPPYFLGSAVVIKRACERKAQIVDGQQRLTSLTILLSCLRYAINDKEIKETLSDFIYQKGNKIKGTSPTYRLQARQRDQSFFNKIIQESNGLDTLLNHPDSVITANDAQRQMVVNAKAFLLEFKRKNYGEEELEHIASYIIQKCVIVIVASTDEEVAFRIFNVLNDRGKDLTIADILKSEILEKIPVVDQSEYTDKWENIESSLGTNNFKDFFSHLRAIFAKKKAEKTILAEIREYAHPMSDPKSFIDATLLPFGSAYLNILSCDYKSSSSAEKINGLFDKLKRVSHTDWIPSAVFFLAKHYNSPKEIEEFMSQLEKVTLAMEAGRVSLNERLERYAKINDRIEKNEDLFGPESEFILSVRDRELIISNLTGSDIYGKKLLKPVLAKIEENMNDGSISIRYDQLNIEHILPQTPTSEYWNQRFTTEEKIKWTNNLGNLSLINIRKNSQAKNYDFGVKIDAYFRLDGKSSNLAMVNELADLDDWTPVCISNRNIKLVNLFLDALSLNLM